MKAWIEHMTATYLAILGMIVIALFALSLGGVASVVGAVLSEPEVVKNAVTIAAIAGTVVTLLGGFIGGYEIGKRNIPPSSELPATAVTNITNTALPPVPEMPAGQIEEL